MNNTAAELPLPDDCPPIALVTEQAITLKTVIEYLMGSREAILLLAGNSNSLWLGFLFVLSAGFAREYDGEDLWHEPWHLLLPLAASLVTSLMLFLLMNTIALARGVEWKSARYRVFLSLYWMTAPLAWIYAIPVEQFMTAGDATSTNLWLLAAVSAWRVLLITRVCSVLYGAKFGSCLLPVTLFADSVALALLSQLDLLVIAMMGGVRLTEAERSLVAAKFLVQFFGLLTWLIWFLGTWGVALSRSASWKWGLADVPPSNRVGRPVWCLAAAALGIWIFILPWTQPPQQLRGLVERAFRAGQYRETLDFMSAHRQDEFPRHWSPPPQIGFNRQRPQIVKVIAALKADDPPWVRSVFFDKLDAALGHHYPWANLWVEADITELLDLLLQSPEGEEVLRNHEDALRIIARRDQGQSVESQRKVAQTLLFLAGTPPATGDWTEARIQEWNQFLGKIDGIDDRKVVQSVHGERLKKVLETNPPPGIQTWIEQFLRTTDEHE